MSALAHMLEDRGIPTVALGLVRVQMERVRPPRGLWTPFQLGRPLGEPEDPGFQRRVLLQALRLLERDDGPVLLEDFPDDPPGWTDSPEWRPPFETAEPLDADPAAAARQLAAELARLRPAWDTAKARRGRTTVGLSGQDPDAWPGFVADVLAGGKPVVAPQDAFAPSLRFFCDDLKAMYSEAAQAAGPVPASRQVDGWFWRSTVAGRALVALRHLAVAAPDEELRTIGARFMVPAVFLPAAGPG